jgi:hypothetical protein
MLEGKVPETIENVGAGDPVALNWNDAGCSTTNVVLAGDVNAGAWTLDNTWRLRVWLAVPPPFDAWIVSANVPDVVGIPEIVAVPLPLSLKAVPAGRVPVSLSDAAGASLVETVKDPAAPRTKGAVVAEVNLGGPSTTAVNAWVADDSPLVTVTVTG